MKVLKINNPLIRTIIENVSAQYCGINRIQFIQDGNGDWITSVENIENIRFNFIDTRIKAYLEQRGINNIDSVKKFLQNYCTEIDYVAPPDVEI